ncbi:MAG: reverse transcriptase domain-containing protein [Candidatus Thiodiazotropha sp.]
MNFVIVKHFIDFKKEFDRVCHAALGASMRKYHIDVNLANAIVNFFDKAASVVQMNGSTKECFRTTLGVRQGCQLSPTLFNIFPRKYCTMPWKNMTEGLA